MLLLICAWLAPTCLQVAQGLSHLGATAAGARPAFLRLEIRNTSLASPDAISHCVHLQEVVLPDNSLTTLRQLGQLKDLTILDVSNNKLTQVGKQWLLHQQHVMRTTCITL